MVRQRKGECRRAQLVTGGSHDRDISGCDGSWCHRGPAARPSERHRLAAGRSGHLDTSGLVLDGLAFTFKRGCDAAGYTVRGRFSLQFGMRQFELEGPAPVRAKKGCAVPYYDIASPNATLTFDLAWD